MSKKRFHHLTREKIEALLPYFSNLEIANLLKLDLEKLNSEFPSRRAPNRNLLVEILLRELRDRKLREAKLRGSCRPPSAPFFPLMPSDNPVEVLIRRCAHMGFSIRVENVLEQNGVEYMYELLIKQPSELIGYRNFGRRCLSEIKENLVAVPALRLGMAEDDPLIVEAKQLLAERAS